ncbi:MAG: CvpA family protein [Planctomycetota bacterium]
MYYTVVGIVLFASFAMMVREGAWNNLIQLFAILIGGVTAFGVHQPLVVWIDEQTDGAYTYLLDVAVLWLVFIVVVALVKQLAQFLSKSRVAMAGPADHGVGVAVGLVAAWLLTGFTVATLHAAPLARATMSGNLDYGDKVAQVEGALGDASPITRPDVAWLRMMEGVLAPERFGGAGFKAAIYVQQHTRHRAQFEKIATTFVKR